MRREVVEESGKAAGREAVLAADTRALLEVNGIFKVVFGEDLAGDLE
jgi:hypothetical protein